TEALLVCAAAVLLYTEALSSCCMHEIERLSTSIQCWDWLSGRPRRAAVASAFLGEATFDNRVCLSRRSHL
ncbi:hypothetical protein T484DRAFT_1792486, partial [Baffinella frigidus]